MNIRRKRFRLAETFPAKGGIFGFVVTSQMISADRFRALRLLARHKQSTLALALGCSERSLRDFEKEKTGALYCVNWADLVRELRIKPKKMDG